MGAVRGPKSADPTETLQPLCQPGSGHRWIERQRLWLSQGKDVIGKRGSIHFDVTYRCYICKTVIKITTKPANFSILTKKLKYDRKTQRYRD